MAEKLRIAILSSASRGGAGLAAFRVYQALNRSRQVEADFIDMDAIGALSTEVSPQSNCSNGNKTDTHFTAEIGAYCRGWLVEMLSRYDVINVHWSSFLVSVAELAALAHMGVPLIFTCHDYYYFTGGCHYPAGCTGFSVKLGCAGCPQVDKSRFTYEGVISRYKMKRRLLALDNVHLSAPSQFLVSQAVKAGLIPEERTHVLRNAYDAIGEASGQRIPSAFNICLIADTLAERRKAMQLAIEAVSIAQAHPDYDIRLQLVGQSDDSVIALLESSGIAYISHGRITEHEKIVDVFRQCQVILTASYEDNWPNILVEAGSYGCIPVVGSGHGCEEFCRTYGVGAVANRYDAQTFADRIIEVISSYDPVRTGVFARHVRKDHESDRVAQRYLEAFQQVLFNHGSSARGVLSMNTLVSENFLPYGDILGGGKKTWHAVATGPFADKGSSYGFRQYSSR